MGIKKEDAAQACAASCPKCGSPIHTTDTRPCGFLGQQAVRRRHTCKACRHKQSSIAFMIDGPAGLHGTHKAIQDLLTQFISLMPEGCSMGDRLIIKEFARIISETYVPPGNNMHGHLTNGTSQPSQ